MSGFRRILAPTDFTEASQHALEWAVELAARLGASVTVLHAYEIPVVGFPDGAMIATADVAARIAQTAQDALDRSVATVSGRGAHIDGVLRDGAAAEEIQRVADEIDADLIVIGSHGRRGLARALLGSVAENVVRHAHRPVVTIRAPA